MSPFLWRSNVCGLSAPSVFPRKSHANSFEEVNFSGNHYLTSLLRFSDAFALVGWAAAGTCAKRVVFAMVIPKTSGQTWALLRQWKLDHSSADPTCPSFRSPPPKLASFGCRWGLCCRIVPRVPSLIYPPGVSSQRCLYCSAERFAWKVCIFQETAVIKYTWKKALWWIIRT